jgi:hypothetical protein
MGRTKELLEMDEFRYERETIERKVREYEMIHEEELKKVESINKEEKDETFQ